VSSCGPLLGFLVWRGRACVVKRGNGMAWSGTDQEREREREQARTAPPHPRQRTRGQREKAAVGAFRCERRRGRATGIRSRHVALLWARSVQGPDPRISDLRARPAGPHSRFRASVGLAPGRMATRLRTYVRGVAAARVGDALRVWTRCVTRGNPLCNHPCNNNNSPLTRCSCSAATCVVVLRKRQRAPPVG
jgi:hypothetical protein